MLVRVRSIVLLVAMLCPAVARADIRVESLESGDWFDTVQALQRDLRSEGRTLHLVVRDPTGYLVPCDMYAIELHGDAAVAFASDGCGRRGFITTMRLVHRDALFAPDDPVSRPRRIPLTVLLPDRTAIVIGGETSPFGREVACNVRVRPYLQDFARGGRVDLMPDRYVMRVLDRSITVTPDGDGWSLRGVAGAELRVEYEIVDTRTNAVVLHDRTSLACRDERLDAVPRPTARERSLPRHYRDEYIAGALVSGHVAVASLALGIGNLANDPRSVLGTATLAIGASSALLAVALAIAARVSHARLVRDEYRDAHPPPAVEPFIVAH